MVLQPTIFQPSKDGSYRCIHGNDHNIGKPGELCEKIGRLVLIDLYVSYFSTIFELEIYRIIRRKVVAVSLLFYEVFF